MLGVLTCLGFGLAPGLANEARADFEGMDLVPAGEFFYGDDQGEPDEKPRRKLTLPAFFIDHVEVTVAAYARCVAEKRCAPVAAPNAPANAKDGAAGQLPVVGVSFSEASAYCAFAGKRLPTETEWEKVARGEQGRRFPWGDVFDCARGNFGTFAGDGRCAEEGAPGRPVAVGSFPGGASPYGALDLAGNVWEWVDGRYDYAPLARSELRVLRGGGCCSIFGLPRASDRLALPLGYRDVDIGFRCARNAVTAPEGKKVR